VKIRLYECDEFQEVSVYLHIPFANKGIDAINISNILNGKEVAKEILPYFKNQSVPIVSYCYTNSIGQTMFPIDVLRFSEFRTMRNHLSEILMLNDIQITSYYMSRWVVLKRRVGAVTSQMVLKVLFYVNILQCFFVVENVCRTCNNW
jgi:hypothetical protein